MEIISMTLVIKSLWRYVLLVFIIATILLSITAPRSLSNSSFYLEAESATSAAVFLAVPTGTKLTLSA